MQRKGQKTKKQAEAKQAEKALKRELPKDFPSTGFWGTLRYFLLQQVASGTSFILKLQSRRNRFLDGYSIFATTLGDLVFYVLLIPWFFWTGREALGRKFILLLVSGTYFGNLLKAFLGLPRPPSPPVWTPPRKKMEDYGMPSTHSLNALSLPLFLIYYHWNYIQEWSLGWQIFVLGAAFFWAGSISFSRMYIGVHSPADVVVGFGLGIIILTIWVNICDQVDWWIMHSEHVTAVLICMLAIATFHPRSSRPTPSFKQSLGLMGIAAGVIFGSSVHHKVVAWSQEVEFHPRFMFNPDFFCTSHFGHASYCVNFYRVVFGLAIIQLSKIVGEFLLGLTFGYVFNHGPFTVLVKRFAQAGERIALPHPMALPNLDAPVVDVQSINRKDSAIHTIVSKNDVTIFVTLLVAFVIGMMTSDLIPVVLDLFGVVVPKGTPPLPL